MSRIAIVHGIESSLVDSYLKSVVNELWSVGCFKVCFFINKILLGYGYIHSFMHYLWRLSHYNAELSRCDRDYMANKA